ncbi:hypothetical protein A9X01_13885 [Mycobacterium asiaticum]|uniref:Uncharacterized protein n=1 Tax=Mycobacterium asiaticum TaxID=1790 RepID=A0A1A3CTD4_MYCAS|nr:hypothetical protein A9X01_13885 [Mycobacterium asiaticum]
MEQITRTTRERRIDNLVEAFEERDEAKRQVSERKAQALINVDADRAMDGLTFLTFNDDSEPIWGAGAEVLAAQGEGVVICGPQGVGKSTLAQQLVLARMGITSSMLLGYPVARDERPIFYLAMDRPMQIRRSLARMVDLTEETAAATIKRQLIVWKGRVPIKANEAPEAFAEWVAQHGRNPGLVIVDSLKDLLSGLIGDDDGIGFNDAMQRVIENGTEFLSLHHQRKATADNLKPAQLSDVYGSGWLTAGQGSVLLLWGQPGASSVELSHLKQPQERVGPLIIKHQHGEGASTKIDAAHVITALADRAGEIGISEADAVAEVFGIDDPAGPGYVAAKSSVRRTLNKLARDKVLAYEAGSRGGSGGGGRAARWRICG